jgi:four helix bundle protein
MKKAPIKNLKCWQASRQLVTTVHSISENEKLANHFFLKSSLKRKAVLAMSNIAEGFDRTSKEEFILHLNSTQRAVAEIKCMAQLLADQNYIETDKINMVINLIANDTHTCTGELISFLQNNI